MLIATVGETLRFGEVEYSIIDYPNIGTSSLCPLQMC